MKFPALSSLAAPLVLVALAPFVAAPAPAGPQDADATPDFKTGTYAIDGTHSSVVFRIKHLDVSNFYGRFNSVSGSYHLDLENPEACTIQAKIDPSSVDTGSDGRDKHIRSADFLDVETYGLASFESTSVERQGDGLSVTGKLTLHGVTKELVTYVELVGAAEAMQAYRTGVEARLLVNRSDFGMDLMLDKLGDQIELTLSLEGMLQQ